MKKIVRTNLTDQISSYIQNEILKGTWAPGEKLPSETELSEALGVSRMSLRSAIQRCNAIGLTETRVGEGTFVRDFNLRSYFGELYDMNLLGNDPSQINDLRCVLQIASVRLALTKGVDEKDVSKLEQLLDKMYAAIDANDLEQFHKLDFQFHRAVCGLCHNEPLYIIYDALEFVINDITKQNVEHSFTTSHGYQKVMDHHKEIVESIKNRDMERMVTELMASRKRSESYYSSQIK